MPQELIPSEQHLETPIRYVPAERLAVVGEPRIPALPHNFVTSPEPELESLSAPLSHYLWILTYFLAMVEKESFFTTT